MPSKVVPSKVVTSKVVPSKVVPTDFSTKNEHFAKNMEKLFFFKNVSHCSILGESPSQGNIIEFPCARFVARGKALGRAASVEERGVSAKTNTE